MKITKIFIFILAIGLVSCSNNKKNEATTKAPDKTEATSATPAAPSSDASGKFKVDVATSSILWTGKKVLGSHNGTIKVSKGLIAVAGGKITGGAFEIDMNSIVDQSVADAGDRADLEGHLKSADFFDVANHPKAIFTISKIEELEKNLQNITHKFYGDLTIKGIKKSIEFTGSVLVMDTKLMLVTPAFNINRTDWGVNFHSGILGTVKDKIIEDNIALVLDIKASK